MPWCVTLCSYWASQSHQTCFGMNTFPFYQNWLIIQVQAIFHGATPSHTLQGPNPPLLATLDAIQKRDIRLIDEPTLIVSLNSLVQRSFFVFFLMQSNARRGAPARCSPYESRKILALPKRRESWSCERLGRRCILQKLSDHVFWRVRGQ